MPETTDTEISIRKAIPSDYSALCELFDELDALHRDHLPHMFQKPPGPARDRDYYLELIADEGVGFFVAGSGENILGFVHAAIRETPAIPLFVPRRYAVLIDLLVRSGYRNRGIGRMLVDKAQAWTIAEGATSIELNVYAFNKNAIAFYKDLGYQTISRKMSKDLE